MGDVSRKGDERRINGGGIIKMRQDQLFGCQHNTGGLRNLREKKKKKKVENWKLKIEKNGNGNLRYGIYLNLAASRISVAMIGWTGACFYFSFFYYTL